MRLVRVPLRISLAGGGSDIPQHYEKHGGSVVSFTINKYIYIATKPCTEMFPHKYRLVYSQVEETNSRITIKHPIIYRVLRQHNVANIDLDVMSDIPAGTGMGSSSAFTVGLHASLCSSELTKRELAEYACNTEINELKEPIGKQDQYAAAFGGCNLFEFTKDKVIVRPLSTFLLEERLHLIYLGKSRSASNLLVVQSKKDNSVALDKMAALAQVAAGYIRMGVYDDLGEVIRHGWELKKTLSPNISNERIDTIINTALANGATGGKLLGAGGTGFVLLFCPVDNRYRMLEALLPLNLTYVPFEMDEEGCKVLYED